MIRRIYIDNYLTWVNNELEIARFQLLLGLNGTGKSAIGDVLWRLQRHLRGEPVAKVFPYRSRTIWQKSFEQQFELDIERDQSVYRYRLRIQHQEGGQKCRILSEEVTCDAVVLFQFDGAEAHLFRDDGSAGPSFGADWTKSMLPSIGERTDNIKLSWFRDRMERVWVIRPEPVHMLKESADEATQPDMLGHEFVKWLRHVSQEDPEVIAHIRTALADGPLPGLISMRLEKSGSSVRTLKFEFQDESDTTKEVFEFDELSPGQRNLVLNFALLHAGVVSDSTLFLDEPDNYVSSREIQPWLSEMVDRVDEVKGQCILVSHHSEVLNYLAPTAGLELYREGSLKPTRVRAFEWSSDDDALSPAELVARGWR